ncbi:MAG: PD-(D/E)XK nuclease family protein [Bacteroidales bacterium]|nr:PD-(D/E)XK nuclease family protein [Bacteroidales bacterium]
MSFLSDLSKSIVTSGMPLQETVVVLPNERARRMLVSHISDNLRLPAFLPVIYSIEHFIDMLSPLQTLDKLNLLVRLRKAIRLMDPPMEMSFDEMLTWAPAYLSDIDEIDMQLQDGEYVFRALAFDKEFTIAMANAEDKSGLQEKMSFYARLAELYTLFRQQLRQDGKAYGGLKYRDCAENIGVYAHKLHFKHLVFAGFHVFTPSELAVISYLKEHFQVSFYFDTDPFYCDFNQEDRFTTAYFLRKICSGLNLSKESLQYVNHHYEEIQKRIQIVGISKEMNQIYYALDQINRIQEEEGNLDNTAVVLADEQLLLPFLSAYGMEGVNVTMGYPFKATPAYTLLNTLLELYQSALRYSLGGEMRFHHRDVVALLRNPLVRQCLFPDEALYKEKMTEMESNQRALYFRADLPGGYLPDFTTDTKTLLPALIAFVEQMLGHIASDSQGYALLSMLLEALQTADAALENIHQDPSYALSTVKYAIGLQTDTLSLPIKGDPLKGLQVMGLLETRTLDFKHIIMLSVNEGVLPAGISYNTLLPFEIRYDNDSLPNYLYKDQVYAYHFFRLLQRAEDIVLVYNNNSDTSLMEKSRFITQLEFLKKERHLDNIQLEYPQVSFQFKASVPETIEVVKSTEILEKLKKMRFSATALTRYINCPLQFYYRNLCGIEPRQTFQERIESNIIGTVVHAILESVFNEIKAKPADYKQIIDDFQAHAEERIAHEMLNCEDLHLSMYDLTHGRTYLATRMVKNDVCSYLQKAVDEFKGGNVEMIGTEIKVSCDLPVDKDLNVNLYGVIDRLQMFHNDKETCPVIVDYKTGKVDDKFLNVNAANMNVVVEDVRYKQMLQLLFYALLLKRTRDEDFKDVGRASRMQCGIMCIKEANKQGEYPDYWYPAKIEAGNGFEESISEDVLISFQSSLQTLLLEILDEKKTFQQTDDESHCGYCDFKHICRRG